MADQIVVEPFESGWSIESKVQGSARKPYLVEVLLLPGPDGGLDVERFCSCPIRHIRLMPAHESGESREWEALSREFVPFQEPGWMEFMERIVFQGMDTYWGHEPCDGGRRSFGAEDWLGARVQQVPTERNPPGRLRFMESGVAKLRSLGWEVAVEPDFPWRMARPESWFIDAEPPSRSGDGPQQDRFGVELGAVVDPNAPSPSRLAERKDAKGFC